MGIMKKLTQEQKLLAAMMEGEILDNHIALHKYGVKALSTIIGNLRRQGYVFEKGYVPWGNRRRLTTFELVGTK